MNKLLSIVLFYSFTALTGALVYKGVLDGDAQALGFASICALLAISHSGRAWEK